MSASPGGFDNPRDTRDARYATESYIFGSASNAYPISQQALFRRGDRALAVADGEGQNGV